MVNKSGSDFSPNSNSDNASTTLPRQITPEPSPHRYSTRNLQQQQQQQALPPETPVRQSQRQQLQTPDTQPQKNKQVLRPSFFPGQKFGPKELKMPARKTASKAPRKTVLKKGVAAKKPPRRRYRPKPGGKLITIIITIKLLLIQNSQGSSRDQTIPKDYRSPHPPCAFCATSP